MEAAVDNGYVNGLVIPFHYRDRVGAYFSSVCTLFWKDAPEDFDKRIQEIRHEITLVLIYWAQQVIDVSTMHNGAGRLRSGAGEAVSTGPLTSREQEVLLWAAQGKTSEDTAGILSISRDTVESHIKSCIAKLDAANKTQAVVKAIFHGYIIP